ncbi:MULTISPECIES: sensor histidine kinase [Emticicia]|uniref:sensor histidine kinase n=1 Tax=Emticicia TaxID=312278 RepID=UPI0007D8C56C|nr:MULTISPECIES: histidine kinase [Emticicia]
MYESLKKFRQIEFGVILFAFVVYITRRLFYIAADFDSDVTRVEDLGVQPYIIWRNLASYDHVLNTIFPTIASAILFFLAWYLFHYEAFPRWRNKELKQKYIFYTSLVASAILVFASVFVYNYMKRYWDFRYDIFHEIVGFKVFSLFRKLHLITNTYAGIIVILLYEAVTQVFYHNQKLYNQFKQPKHQFFGYFILSISLALIIFWMLQGSIANLVINGRGTFQSILIIMLSIGFHYLFFKLIIPYYAKLDYNKLDNTLYAFFGFCAYILLGIVLMAIWMIIVRDYDSFLTLYAIPNIIGLSSAGLRWAFFNEKQNFEVKISQTTAELNNLRSQINPHFLFNALNTLYSISLKEQAERTSDGIQKLGDMMRFMLNENHQERIPLSKEVEYLENYIAIQRMRIDENHNIEIKVNIQQPEKDIFIAPMLLNPFIENAFKHGISFRKPSWIYITLTQDTQRLYFKVHNSTHPKNEQDTEQKNHGIGLENVKKRLELIYPNRHTLDIQVSDNDYFVSLILGIY